MANGTGPKNQVHVTKAGTWTSPPSSVEVDQGQNQAVVVNVETPTGGKQGRNLGGDKKKGGGQNLSDPAVRDYLKGEAAAERDWKSKENDAERRWRLDQEDRRRKFTKEDKEAEEKKAAEEAAKKKSASDAMLWCKDHKAQITIPIPWTKKKVDLGQRDLGKTIFTILVIIVIGTIIIL